MTNNISLCITFKNRAKFLDMKLHNLQFQDYDLKKIEICISDGYSTDNLMEVIKKWYPKFYQIKYVLSDRSVLPFTIPSNGPACDRNSLIANIVTFEKIIITDAEVLLINENHLAEISKILEKNKDVCFYCTNQVLNDKFNFKFNNRIIQESDYKEYIYGENLYENALCMGFNKTAFIENGGFEEEYAKCFSTEDTAFIRWYRKNKIVVESKYKVIHLWHPRPFKNSEMVKVSRKLSQRLTKGNIRANINNKDWKRKEMIKNIKIFKKGN